MHVMIDAIAKGSKAPQLQNNQPTKMAEGKKRRKRGKKINFALHIMRHFVVEIMLCCILSS